MPKRITPIDFKDFEKFALGDVVEFIAKSAEDGITELEISKANTKTTFKTGHTKMVSPTMVVSEILVESEQSQYDGGTGNKKPHIKLNCQWYSHKFGQFHNRWFEITLLKKCDFALKQKSLLKINDVVILKTAAKGNIQSESILKHVLDEETSQTKYSIKQIFDTSMYLPPKMVIAKIEINDDKKPLFDKSKGYRKRDIAKKIAKCVWFNHVTGKYSEAHLPLEIIMRTDNINLDIIRKQFDLIDD